jgi:5-methylcytosine-specific restriction endonuclease McrA
MSSFTDKKIDNVWNKAKIPLEKEKDVWRKDYADAWIKKSEYGKESEYGWEVDHAKPSSKGGSDNLGNLVPLHWRNNRTKADSGLAP